MLKSRWLPSSKPTTTLSWLLVGTLIGLSLASSDGDVSLLCTMVTSMLTGSGRSRRSGTDPDATSKPHTCHVATTD